MDAKIVYNLDPVSGAYIGPQTCYKTSIDEDTWHWTGEALEIDPPSVGENEIQVANSERTAWEIKPCFIGMVYWLPDGTKHTIVDIDVTPPSDALYEKPVEPKTVFTSLEWLEKFTLDEQLGVVGATMTDATVKLWYDKLLAASYVDLADDRILDGLNVLVNKGLLEADRVPEIVTPQTS